MLWYQLIPPFNNNVILLGSTPVYNDTKAIRDVISEFYCMCLRGISYSLGILGPCYDFWSGVTMAVFYTVRTQAGRVS